MYDKILTIKDLQSRKCKFNLLTWFRNSRIKRRRYAYGLGGYPQSCKFGVGFLWGGDSLLTHTNLMLYLYL